MIESCSVLIVIADVVRCIFSVKCLQYALVILKYCSFDLFRFLISL